MNHGLLTALSNPAFDLEEAEQLMHEAGKEIVQLEHKVLELMDRTRQLEAELERLYMIESTKIWRPH